MSTKIKFKKFNFEIIIVFLGVITAFALNEWRTKQNNNDLEELYILDFITETKENIETLEGHITNDSIYIVQSDSIIALINWTDIETDDAISIIKFLTDISIISISQTTHENIISSGDLKILQDYQVRLAVINYHISVEKVQFIYDYVFSYYDKYTFPFIVKNIDLRTGDLIEISKVDILALSNCLMGNISMTRQRISYSKLLLEESRDLLNTLENYHQ